MLLACTLAAASCAKGTDGGLPGLGDLGTTSGAGAGAGTTSSTTDTGVGGTTSTSGAGTSGAGVGGSSPGSTTTATTSTSSTSSSTTSSSSSTGGPCTLGHLVISEIRTRGLAGGSDEFIELWNATGAAVTLDSSWSIEGRSSTGASYTSRWTGGGQTIPAWGHYLLGGTSYTQTTADDTESGITDAGGLHLVHSGTTVDALCYVYGTVTLDSTYACAGNPATNPHDNTATTNVDASLERLPGGSGGNCTDTGDNATDFKTQTPATPQGSASAPTP